jgi:hypothetical protein
MASGRGADESTDEAQLIVDRPCWFTAILFDRAEAETDKSMHSLPILASVVVIDQKGPYILDQEIATCLT